MHRAFQVQWLGKINYQHALELQKELVAKRTANQIPDTLLLLEHPCTYTVGVDGHRQHLLISERDMNRLNIAYHKVDRGGAIFYHSPGQLVAYPILKLTGSGSYHDYIKKLESVIIRTLAAFDIRAFRQQSERGIWVFANHLQQGTAQGGDTVAKIGAIGVKINRDNVTSHGFWINVNPNLQFFESIIPGGVKDCYITSMQQTLNSPLKIGTVIEPVLQSFGEIFNMEAQSVETSMLTTQMPVWNVPSPTISSAIEIV